MDFRHEPGRISLWESGKMYAEITMVEKTPGVVTIDHTYVDTAHRNKGVAAALVKEAAETIRREGKRAHPTCPYAVKWFGTHREYGDILQK